MSMDLYLWKAPVTDDPDKAAKLIDRYFDDKQEDVFEPSPDVAAAAEELLRLYPYRPISGEELLASMSEEERSRYTEQGLAELREFGSYTQPEDGPCRTSPSNRPTICSRSASAGARTTRCSTTSSGSGANASW